MAKIFDPKIFDPAIFGGETEVVDSEDQGDRWLLTLEVNNRTIRFADHAVVLNGVLYREGLVDVDASDVQINFDERSATFPEASISLSPAADEWIDPRIDLPRAVGTLAVFIKGTIKNVVRASVTDLTIGEPNKDGESSAPHQFRLREELRSNPLFPPNSADTDGFDTLEESAKGQALTHVFGDALAVPMFALRSTGDDETEYFVCGHPLVAGSTSALAEADGFPHSNYPGTPPTANTITGIWVGPNQGIRDSLRQTTLGKGWGIPDGAPTMDGTGAVVAAAGRLRWDAWLFRPPFSFSYLVQNAGAGTTAGRGHRFEWGLRNKTGGAADGFRIDLRFDVAANAVQVFVVRDAVSVWSSEVWNPTTPLSNAQTRFHVIVDADGSVTVRIGDEENSFGKVPAVHRGKIQLRAMAEAQRFKAIQMPQEAPGAGYALINLNRGFKRKRDKLNRFYIMESYQGDVSVPLGAQFYRAQDVSNAAQLIRRLIEKHSGFSVQDIDAASFDLMESRLSGIRIGAYFNEQSEIFSLITERIAPQFLVFLTQRAGRLFVMTADPTAAPRRRLLRNRELLDLDGPIEVMPAFTRFEAKFRWNPMLDGGGRLAASTKLGPDEEIVLETHENRFGVQNFPVVEMPDVIDLSAAAALLKGIASLIWKGERVSYVRETEVELLSPGDLVELEDPHLGYSAQRAVFLGRRYLSPSFMVERFQTLHAIAEQQVPARTSDVGSGSSAVTSWDEPFTATVLQAPTKFFEEDFE